MTLRGWSAPNFDTSCPLSFFTNVASRLLSSELNLNLSQLQVYPTNQYTPSVQRLLQVTANIHDATTTNFYPSVFRPVFSVDANTNIWISGYQQVTGVSGINDGQLSSPVNLSALTLLGPTNNLSINIYGIPWIIGARKGLPNFNQFAMLNQVQVTRKLEFSRPSLNAPLSEYTTNQCYVISISNNLSMNFWNSYSGAYPNPVTVYAVDTLKMSLSEAGNTFGGVPESFVYETNVLNWPGSAWSTNSAPSARTPSPNSFLPTGISYSFIQPAGFFPSTGAFESGTNVFDPGPILQFPSMQLATTNWIYAVMLDGSNVIDYVQIAGPGNSTNLAWALADVYPAGIGNNNNDGYVWATNVTPNGIYGISQQIAISAGAATIPNDAFWTSIPGFPNDAITNEQKYFADYLNGNPANTELTMQAPYAPTRTLFYPCLMQANDPLVHYLGSDLDGTPGTTATWYNGSFTNGIWSKNDGASALPVFPVNTQAARYQPWGTTSQMYASSETDTNACNLAFKDPCVIGSDYWNFPTNQSWNLGWLGQVHRGTPWQTVYLKSTDLMAEYKVVPGVGSIGIGTNTWMAWTGDLNPQDAASSRPVMDWQLVDTLASLLNTNNLNTQFSINNPNTGAWTAEFNGFDVSSNILADLFVMAGLNISAGLNGYVTNVISANATQASVIATALETARAGQPGGVFHGVGDILAVPQLSQQSPYLNWNDSSQQKYGINEQAYEAIPSQLLPLLRADSIGALAASNGQYQVRFSGDDGHTYAVQVSADLVNWTGIATNSPVNGTFAIPVTPPANSAAQFYRTLLVQ